MLNLVKHAEHCKAMAAYTDWRIECFKLVNGYEDDDTYKSMCLESRIWTTLAEHLGRVAGAAEQPHPRLIH